jgi:hypothetical protein
MNTTDMYTREKSNMAYLDKMRRDTEGDRLLQRAADGNRPDRARLYGALIVVAGSAIIAITMIGVAVAATSNGATGAVLFLFM